MTYIPDYGKACKIPSPFHLRAFRDHGCSLVTCLFALSLLTVTSLSAELTKLTNSKGRQIEVEILALNDDKAEILVGGKTVSYPMAQLSEESQAEVKRVLDARREQAAQNKASRMKLPDGQDLVTGKLLSFTLKATDQEREWAKDHLENDTDLLQEILVNVSFPEGFDPDKTYPVFFPNDTGPGANANVVRGFRAAGNECGYVVLGAQAVGTSSGNRLSWQDTRGAVVRRAINELAGNWPAIMESEWYFGGNSGGSKNCCYLAVYLYEAFKKSARGFFMSGCNSMRMLAAIEAYKSDKKAVRDARFFVSSGKTDTIATPAAGKRVAEQLEEARLGEVRYELHDGGHGMSQDHLKDALKWFTELREAP